MPTPAKLNLTSTWNLDPLPSTDQTSLAYLLADITESSSQIPTSDPQPLNLSLVLDTSGSMAGAKLQNLKQAVRWVIEHLSRQSSIAITLFDEEARLLVSSTELADTKTLLEQVDS